MKLSALNPFKKKTQSGEKMKTLIITAHPFGEEGSSSRRMAAKFTAEYIKANPEAEVKEIDLYNYNIDFLNADDIAKMFSGQDNKALEIAKEFAAADRYVFASPMWNLSIPAILKAYIDYISYAGVTFKYTENGPVGLLSDKKALYLLSTGGFYSEAPAYNMGKTYLEGILNFYGITDVETIMLEGTNSLPAEEVAKNVETVNAQITEAAQKF
ncbi:NAD(P)H-dependent oxidoreductase [Mollicutes bacterium LVI A0078]|nr:NAD(P)H-dependent oxidoreductase [Mollicutes bacterium LVI A0075]WOO91586.1 NAD(P)H-dependent oxidoreductase [Mollicutes bacterium LVI A0078]